MWFHFYSHLSWSVIEFTVLYCSSVLREKDQAWGKKKSTYYNEDEEEELSSAAEEEVISFYTFVL